MQAQVVTYTRMELYVHVIVPSERMCRQKGRIIRLVRENAKLSSQQLVCPAVTHRVKPTMAVGISK